MSLVNEGGFFIRQEYDLNMGRYPTKESHHVLGGNGFSIRCWLYVEDRQDYIVENMPSSWLDSTNENAFINDIRSSLGIDSIYEHKYTCECWDSYYHGELSSFAAYEMWKLSINPYPAEPAFIEYKEQSNYSHNGPYVESRWLEVHVNKECFQREYFRWKYVKSSQEWIDLYRNPLTGYNCLGDAIEVHICWD